jgi:hypothetical protein
MAVVKHLDKLKKAQAMRIARIKQAEMEHLKQKSKTF